MRRFSDYNPIVSFCYYLLVAGITMFCMNPVILLLSLVGAVIQECTGKNGWRLKTHMGLAGAFVVMALLNPIFQHKGMTVLFLLNDNPVTLEAVLYGLAAATMIVAVIYWSKSFSRDMTEDKLLYLFGRLSPKLALLLSMSLRYVSLFGKQTVKTDFAQRAMGLYKGDNAIDTLQGKTKVFSVMVTWALENGIITADSMEARGYGIGRRTSFSLFPLNKPDVILLLAVLLLGGGTVTCLCLGLADFDYYPGISAVKSDYKAILTYIMYGILALLPLINNLVEEIRWKLLVSKI